MPRLSNIRIGVKLGVMSGLGIVLVATMIVASMYGSSDIEASSREAPAYFRIANPEMAVESQLAATPVRQAPPRESTDKPPRQAAA